MFFSIFRFELLYRLKRPATWIYFLTFFLFVFISVGAGLTPASEKVYHNGPWTMGSLIVTFTMLMMLVCSAVMGVPLYRDIEHGTGQYFFSYPISKSGYFWGRFWGSFFYVVLIGIGLPLGAWLGALIGPQLGWVSQERIGDFGFINYFGPFFTFGLSNLFLASTIFFALVVLTRNIKAIYSSSILLFVLYLLTQFFVRDIENHNLIKILDPFAVNAFDVITRYWTPYEKNTQHISLESELIINRLLWIGIGATIIIFAYARFEITKFLLAVKDNQKQKTSNIEPFQIFKTIPIVSQVFNNLNDLKNFVSLSKIEFYSIIRDNYFKAILFGAVVFLLINYWIGRTSYSVPDLPLTILLMDYKNFNYGLFVYIILLFYTGEAVHREKGVKFNSINDSLPVRNFIFLLSKVAGLLGLTLLLSTVPILLGIIVQILKGYYRFDFPVYLTEMYLLNLPSYIQMVLLTFTIHIILNNKFAGHGVGLIVWITMYMLRVFADLDYNLFFFSYTPPYRWSDMNGLGHFGQAQFWFHLNWLILGSLFLLIAFLFYQRGISGSFRERWDVGIRRFKAGEKLTGALLLIGWLSCSAYIYKNVSITNVYFTAEESRSRSVEYEKILKKYEFIPQPKITDLYIETDIHPLERLVKVDAKITIKNKTNSPIDTIHLSGAQNLKYSMMYNGEALPFINPVIHSKPKYSVFSNVGDTLNYRLYPLPNTLMPGDTAVLNITSITENKGFPNSGLNGEIVFNGTFFSGGLPTFGYNSSLELDSDEHRKKYGLPVKAEELPAHDDPYGRSTLLFNNDADLINFEIVVSTIPNQIAVAPGYLINTWEKDNRKYYHYKQDIPIALFFTVVSAEYEILRDTVYLSDASPVNLEVFYHKHHTRNLDRFMSSFQDGIVYFSQVYGPFQFRQMRLLEFPRYRSFAQSFPNTVPFSENFGWNADFSDPNSFDHVYYVTAHELAHQWWGHQVMPNFTRGSNLVSEALAEYTALILTERKYGSDNMKRFLKDELDNYLRGRANETKIENNLLNSNRAYQQYNKGSLVLYALRDLIGDENVNGALREFRDSFAFRSEPPFAGVNDLYQNLRKHTPDSALYFLEDSWIKLTLYDNRFIKATSKHLGNDEYEVDFTFSVKKYYAEGNGKENETLMDDYINIGIFSEVTFDKYDRRQTNPLYLKKHKLRQGEHTLTIKVKGKPVSAGVDPYNILIDRIPDDNTGKVD